MASPDLPASEGWFASSGRARLETGFRNTERLVSADQGGAEQVAAVGLAGRRQHIAGAVENPLRIFELAQFVANPDQHVGIGTDAVAAAMA